MKNKNKNYLKKYIIYKKKYITLKNKLKGGGNNQIRRLVILSNKVEPYVRFLDNNSRVIKIVAKVASVTATVLSAGLGGDTIVEFLIIIIDSLRVIKSITDIYFLFNTNEDYKFILNKLININFEGIDKTEEKYEEIIEEIYTLDNPEEFIEELCGPIIELLEKIGVTVGGIISAGIPNDNFIFSTIIEQLISSLINSMSSSKANNVINKLNNNYEKLPDNFVELLEDPRELSIFIKKVFKFLKNAIKYNPSTIFMPQTHIIIKLLNFIIKNRYNIALVINKIIGLMYFCLYFLRDECFDNN